MTEIPKLEEVLARIDKPHREALDRLKIENIKDLLYHFPNRYGDTKAANAIEVLEEGQDVTVYGKITKLDKGKTFRGRVPKSTATLTDETGTIKIIWFNQPYIAKMLHEESVVKVTGKVSIYNKKKTFTNPKVEQATHIPQNIGNSLFGENEEHTLYPVYPETKGITSQWIYHSIQKIISNNKSENFLEDDPIPEEILEKYNLPSLKTALIWIHNPKQEDDALAARKRFAFEEIFLIQLKYKQEREKHLEKKSFLINKTEELDKKIKKFVGTFGFDLTSSQKKAVEDILEDFSSGKPMSRLLEGDVGSGKTAVAAATIFASTITRPDETKNFGRLQTAYMVPTEILAKQHFENFIDFFTHPEARKLAGGINIGLITGSGCYKFPSKVDSEKFTKISRAQLLKWVENGEIPILIGTHSLIQKTVNFKNLAYVVIDEQHRFGTNQRQKLARKDDFTPHFLSMTATPIPRTLSLTIYGDLDLTIIDQMPTGRKPVITELVLPNEKERDKTYEKIKKELEDGRQVYVICPRIEEPDPAKQTALNVKSVKAEAKRLKKDVFKYNSIDILHSKIKPDEKDKIMKKFENGETEILVSTSVVEVGVNVPNATVIIIEGAERFGLSQLHQLRGRVIRSNHQAYAYIFADTKSEKSIDRLQAIKTAKDGFELAEYDLKFRGSGELYGKKQWGISDLGMEAIQNIKMVELARKEAEKIIKKDISLESYPKLKLALENKREVHFE